MSNKHTIKMMYGTIIALLLLFRLSVTQNDDTMTSGSGGPGGKDTASNAGGTSMCDPACTSGQECQWNIKAGCDKSSNEDKKKKCCYKCNCLSENDVVLTLDEGKTLLKNIKIGDYVFDGDEFTKVLSVVYSGKKPMKQLILSNIYNKTDYKNVSMTGNHLLYDVKNELVTAYSIVVGDTIYDNYIVNSIKWHAQYALTPITFSGYLNVNGVKVSSYSNSESYAKSVQHFLLPFRWLSDNINTQIAATMVEWLTVNTRDIRPYYASLRKLFGEQIMENQFCFNCISVMVIAFLIFKKLFATMIGIGICAICSYIIYNQRKAKTFKAN